MTETLESHILNLNSIKQLVDINKNFTNFICKFEVESENKQPFEMVVINQRLLDNDGVINFMSVDGETSGEFTMDKNIFDNWFIALRSSEPVKVFVKISLKPLPDNIINNQNIKQNKYNYSIFIALLVILFIILYNMYLHNKTSTSIVPNILKSHPSLLDQLKRVNLS